MGPKIIGHPLRLHEVIIERVNCRRLGDLGDGARPVVDFILKGKTLSGTEVYSYLTVRVSFPEEPKPFFLEITVRGKFVADRPGQRSKLKRFAEKKAILVLLPWAREAVATLTRQMGFPPLYLPLINVEATMRAEEKEAGSVQQGEKP